MPVIAQEEISKAQRDGHVSLPLHPPHTIPAAVYFRDSHIYNSIDKRCVNMIWKERLSIRCDQNTALGVWTTRRFVCFFPVSGWCGCLRQASVTRAYKTPVNLRNRSGDSPLLRCVNARIVRKLFSHRPQPKSVRTGLTSNRMASSATIGGAETEIQIFSHQYCNRSANCLRDYLRCIIKSTQPAA